MQTRIKLFILIFFLIICKTGDAFSDEINESRQFYFQQMDNRNGLSNSAVNVVFQDRDQLLWAGTWDGLNMYDGSSFRVFNYNNETPYGSIGNNVIQDIKEDQNRNIWISTIGGITRFNKTSGKFFKYFYNQGKDSRVAEKEFILTIDLKGRVFCYSKAKGLSIFDTATLQFQPIKLPLANRVIKMETGSDGKLWLLDNNSILYICTIAGNSIRRIQQLEGFSDLTNMFTSNEQIVLTSPQYMYLLDKQYHLVKKRSNQQKMKALIYYRHHYIVAWEAQGISVFDQNFSPSLFMNKEARQLSGTRIMSLNTARNEILWLGTDGNGLIKIFPRSNYFSLISKVAVPDLDKPVRSFSEENGNLWVGTKGNGIIKIQKFWQAPEKERTVELLNSSNGLDNDAVFSIYKSRSSAYMYMGTDGRGINVYDLKAGRIIKWQEIEGVKNIPSFSSVYAILEDQDSSLWLGTSGSGLIHLRLKQQAPGKLKLDSFKQYLSSGTTGPANDIIYALADGDDQKLWIACRYGGLTVLDKKTGEFKTYKAFSYKNSLSNNDVLSLYMDKKKRLWIGTSYGLNCLTYSESKKQSPAFLKFTMDQGLPNNTIHAIEESNTGDIWISTNKGLARLSQPGNAIASFMESDGLQSNEFSDGAVWKSADGHLFFGGIYGFNYFQPMEVTGTTQQPNVMVKDLQMGSTPINENMIQVLSTAQGNTPEYTLDRKNNFFRMALKSMSYLNPAKNEFSYKLEGLDKNWNYSGAMGNISYNNIPPGTYTMMLKWSNGEGGWTGDIRIFKLKVNQYFWITYPALLLYFLVLAISAYIFHIYRKNKLRMKYQLEMEHLLRQKDETVHQQRLNFFTNIAHEIQTPLTLIMGSIEHYLQSKNIVINRKTPGNNYFLSIIHQHTVRLSYLVQQLMEFRKAEAGYLTRNDDFVDLSKMFSSLAQLFLTESAKGDRKYLIEIQEGMTGFIDKDKLEKILFNLLSNAFKHSGPEDTVHFTANYQEESHRLCITVSNSGCNLQPKDLERLFDQFFVGNQHAQHKFSTGIGLAFTKELVQLLGAEIKAELRENWICFNLNLQLEPLPINGKEEEVISSAPSMVLSSLIKQHLQPSAEEENKTSLIDGLHQKTGPSILIVEDEPELRYLLRNILKDQYLVYESGSGTEALNTLRKITPDLIISDVMMPDMDGIQLCREVKNTPVTAQIPFIILSARATIEHQTEGFEVGADAYIPKPFHISYLLVRIRKLLDNQSKMQQLLKDQHINNQFTDADLAETDKKFLEKLLKIIEEQLDEPELNAASIENALSISKMQLYRRLKSLTGMTPAEFIRRIRLKHAADMLLASQYTVSEIFYRTGFNNKSYFFREFKKTYHCAPNEFRQRQYESNMPPVQS
ncbi:histidine kinase [Pedobacter sp. HMWF019]|nr:histidine kinase [Pedobacter sp. HMWF019]